MGLRLIEGVSIAQNQQLQTSDDLKQGACSTSKPSITESSQVPSVTAGIFSSQQLSINPTILDFPNDIYSKLLVKLPAIDFAHCAMTCRVFKTQSERLMGEVFDDPSIKTFLNLTETWMQLINIGPYFNRLPGASIVSLKAAIYAIPDFIINYNINNIKTSEEQGVCALISAVKSGQKECVQLLILAGVDVNAKNNKGETPLHVVTSSEIAQLLVANGADVNASNGVGMTPLHVVTSSEIAQLLVANGANVNANKGVGLTPLHVVTTPEIVQLLVVNGADVNAKNNHGETPLHWSAFFGLVAKVNALLRFGADADSHDEHNRTPLDLANDYSQEVVELIEKFKSDSLK